MCLQIGLYQARHHLSKLKEYVEDIFKLDENGRKFSKWVEKL